MASTPAKNGFSLQAIKKSDPLLRTLMEDHYSQPKGFVGRQLFYEISFAEKIYGCIAFGSATRHLPNRPANDNLNAGLNNIFYHIVKPDGGYPIRNFTTYCLLNAEKRACEDYERKYGDRVQWLETLVELPRTGDLYRKAGYQEIGLTKGYTCKRIGGESTDSWGGKRIWDTKNLRPKRVFYKPIVKDVSL